MRGPVVPCGTGLKTGRRANNTWRSSNGAKHSWQHNQKHNQQHNNKEGRMQANEQEVNFMPVWERRLNVRAMRIDAIEAPTVREPFMWNLVGNLPRGQVHIERVHADFIGQHKPEVGGFLVSTGGQLAYWPGAAFGAVHRLVDVPHDIEPLAGKVWNGPEQIPRFLVKPDSIAKQGEAMDGVDIDRAHKD